MDSINLYDAIRQMRAISSKHGHFQMIFMSYSRSRGTSDGFVEVARARLRPQPDKSTQYSDYMLNYVDLDTGEEKRLWQPLLMSFNGMKIELK